MQNLLSGHQSRVKGRENTLFGGGEHAQKDRQFRAEVWVVPNEIGADGITDWGTAESRVRAPAGTAIRSASLAHYLPDGCRKDH